MKTYTNKQYNRKVKKSSPNSPIIKNCFLSFIIGGTICTMAQVIFRGYMILGLDINNSRTAVSVSLIFISAVLTALGIYEKIAKYAGAGTLVPITGFANAMVSPAMEFKREGIITGLGVKLFVVSGPVLVFGISSSVIYGIILFFIGG
ncbi:MAG: SpoVA/SpoVAEb family sporulation membrane protein [Clostridia bacterium]